MTKSPPKADKALADQLSDRKTATPDAPAILPQTGGVFLLEAGILTQVEGGSNDPLTATAIEKDA